MLGDEIGLFLLLEARVFGFLGQFLGLAHIHFVFNNLLKEFQLLLLVADVDEGAGVSHGDVAVADGDLHLGGQLQQPQEVGHGTTAFAYLVAHFLLGHVALVDEALVGDGHLDGVQVFAVDVLDEGQFQHLLVVGHSYEYRNLG